MQKGNNKINSEKLRNAIMAKGIKVSDAGVMCGYSKSGIQNAIDRHFITPSMIVLIDKVLGIPYEEYKETEPEPELKKIYKTPVIEEDDQIDPNQIAYKMMQSAAYAGVAEFCNKHLGSIIQQAIMRALKEKEMEG